MWHKNKTATPTGADLIAQERQRQVDSEGWSSQHDDMHDEGDLAMAAACYAATQTIYTRRDLTHEGSVRHPVVTFAEAWPWEIRWDKRDKHDRIRQLVIAGALIAAEIDRLQRLEHR